MLCAGADPKTATRLKRELLPYQPSPVKVQTGLTNLI